MIYTYKNNEQYKDGAILSNEQVKRLKALPPRLYNYFHKAVLSPLMTDFHGEFDIVAKRGFVEYRLSQIEMANYSK